jgi:hypothetical protein
MMKKTLLYSCLSTLLVAGSGCNSDFLTIAPESNINSVNFYRNADDMVNAINAAYSGLRLTGVFNQGMYVVGEIRSDNTEILDAQAGIDQTQIDAFTTQTNNGIVSTFWNHHYLAILYANTVIDRIESVQMDAALKSRIVGEAHFLRALYYFNLVRAFGDVPLVLKEITDVQEGYQYQRKPIAEVYAQIESDLANAEGSLPASYTGANVGRATSGAAKGLLAKVYLTQKKWDQAASKANEVIASGTYSLLPSYADVFSITNKNHKESLFDVQYKKGGTGLGSPFNTAFAPRNSGTIVTTIGAGGGQNHPTMEFINSYEEGDLRKPISLALGYQSGATFVAVPYVKKFIDPAPFAASDADNNWPVLRYADLLLMRAEALNELSFVADGESFSLLNQIRKRAGLAEVDATVITDQGAMRLAIENERRIELAFENHRWFDLVRTDRALEVMRSKGRNIQPYQLLLPIPQNQIDINPTGMVQNPEYR